MRKQHPPAGCMNVLSPNFRANSICGFLPRPTIPYSFSLSTRPSSSKMVGGNTLAESGRKRRPWRPAFFSIALLLSLLVFIGEAVRDALDPRKTFR